MRDVRALRTCIQHARESIVVGKASFARDLVPGLQVWHRLANRVTCMLRNRKEGRDVLPRGLQDGAANALVAGAATERVLESNGDVLFSQHLACRLFFFNERFRGHDDARRADSALHRAVIQKRLLQRMQFAVLRKVLDGFDLRSVRLEGRIDATHHGCAIHQHRANTALGLVAPNFGSG